MTEDIGETIDDLYRDRLRTLLSVDDLVSAVVGSLDVSVYVCKSVCVCLSSTFMTLYTVSEPVLR